MSDFSQTIDLLHRSLDVASLRQDVYANNLANADVPNFKRSDVNFESYLKRALDSEQYKPAVTLATDNPRHISNDTSIDYRTVQPRRVLDYLTTSKADGNNVDAEQEEMKILQNQMLYELLTSATNFQFSQVKVVLQEA
jgi:flagellar basal-body rod protein FlgB